MNFTLVSLGLALAKPLISFLAERRRQGADNSPLFTLVHAIRGRRRYRSGLLRDPAFAESFRTKLLGIAGMKIVTVNPVTGSALLEYSLDDSAVEAFFQEMNMISAAAGEETFFAKAAQAFSGEPGNGSSGNGRGREVSCSGSGSSRGGYPAEGDTGIREIFFGCLAGISRGISARTGGSLDLNSLLGILLAGRGLYKIVKHGQLPSGPQLLWWGYNLFKSRGRYVRAVS